MRKRVIIISISCVVALIVLINLIAMAGKNLPVYPKKIALINIDGEIDDTTHILELLNYYNDMRSVKAIVLRVNSPGGGVAASQEVYRQIMKVKANGMKIIVSMNDVAASGAYYISSAADKIYANQGTVTGSIGVIANFMNAEKLLGKIGIGYTTIKSGKYKDTGSFSRAVTEEDKAYLNHMIQDVLDQFVGDVVYGREVPLAKAFGVKEKDPAKETAILKALVLKDIADGRVFTGREALKMGLVDEIGNIDDAIEGAATMIGLKGRPLVISERKPAGIEKWLDTKLQDIGLKSDNQAILQFKMR